MPPNGRPDTVFTASSSRWRGRDRERRQAVGVADQPHGRASEAARPARSRRSRSRGSVAAVTSASAAEASRGVRPGMPATAPPRHRARHVEREQQPLAGRLDVAERRVERGVERVDHLAAPASRSPRPRSAAARRVGPQRGQHGDRVHARPAQPLGVAELRDRLRRAAPSPASAGRRASSSPGCGSAPSSACRRAAPPRPPGEVRCSVWSASRGRRYSRTSAADLVARRRLLGARRSPRPAAADRPCAPPRAIHSNSRACSSETSSCGLPAPTRRAGWARRSRSRCVQPSRWRYLTAW